MQRATVALCPPQPACVAAYVGETPVDGEIVVRHALDRESALERRPDLGTVEHGQPAYVRRRLRLVVDNEARDALIDNLGYRAPLKAMTGVPQAIASIITSPNGSGQSI